MVPEIAVILPKREGFSKTEFGAVTLCVYDNWKYSQFKDGVIVYGGQTRPDAAIQGVAYRHIPVSGFRTSFSKTKAYARKVAKILAKQKPHLIEVHNRPEIAGIISTRLDVPVCLHFHNDPQLYFSRLFNSYNRKVMVKICDGIFCVSKYVKQRMLAGNRSDASKIWVIPNGIDTRLASNNDNRRENQFVFVGRIIRQKGVLEFVKAATMILPCLPGWKIKVAGSISGNDAYGRSVVKRIKALGNRGEYLGHMVHSKVMQEFRRSKIAVLPSYWQEPFGRTILEAMAAGCAVITCANGGITELVNDSAVLADGDYNVDDLALKMKMLATDNDLVKVYASKAAQRAAELFDIRNTTAMLDHARKTILSRFYGDNYFDL